MKAFQPMAQQAGCQQHDQPRRMKAFQPMAQQAGCQQQ
jgi:hypothetical protein